MYERALAIWEKRRTRHAPGSVLISEGRKIRLASSTAPEPPGMATILNNLAAPNQARARYDEALPMYERALAIAVKRLGPRHPTTHTMLQNFSSLYRTQGRDEALERLLREYGQLVSGVSISLKQFVGTSFEISQPVNVMAIGGHIAASPSVSIFGAVQELADLSVRWSTHWLAIQAENTSIRGN